MSSKSIDDDLDLVERTPHAFRGESWLAATKRLDAAGVHYVPGRRYYETRPRLDSEDTKDAVEDIIRAHGEETAVAATHVLAYLRGEAGRD